MICARQRSRWWKENKTQSMCRNIRKLRQPDRAPTEAELRDAALQFVRKVSGYRVPSRANQVAFERAVADITAITRVLFKNLASKAN
jgi:hypothetical protein